MFSTDVLLSEFIDDWNAGRRPRVRDYLRRVPDDRARTKLAQEIDAWLEVAPTPDFDAQARAAIRAEPVVQRVFAAVGDDAGLWPQVLPDLRARSRLSVRELAGRLVERFSLSTADEDRTAAYLERMEHGKLDATRVSRRLLDALADLLDVGPDTLAETGTFGRALRPAAPGGTLLRADGDAEEWVRDDLAVLSRAALEPAPPSLDEVDRLFLGGPDA
jgi:transcriptional regulator with XRE-family HTH domain